MIEIIGDSTRTHFLGIYSRSLTNAERKKLRLSRVERFTGANVPVASVKSRKKDAEGARRGNFGDGGGGFSGKFSATTQVGQGRRGT